jgi:hypothetical protein
MTGGRRSSEEHGEKIKPLCLSAFVAKIVLKIFTYIEEFMRITEFQRD